MDPVFPSFKAVGYAGVGTLDLGALPGYRQGGVRPFDWPWDLKVLRKGHPSSMLHFCFPVEATSR